MTNNTTKATALMVREFNKRHMSLSRKDITISEVTTVPRLDKSDAIKIVKGTVFVGVYQKNFKFTYLAADDKLLFQDDLFGGVQ